MTHKGVSDIGGSVSAGGALVPQHFEFHARAVALLPHAGKLLPRIVQRLRRAAREELGTEWCDTWAEKYARYSQGDGGLPGAMSLAVLLNCYSLHKALCVIRMNTFTHKLSLHMQLTVYALISQMDSYAKRMANNLSQPGDWCVSFFPSPVNPVFFPSFICGVGSRFAVPLNLYCY